MRYGFMALGLMLLVIFFLPIYHTTGHCCGHAYDEAMTIAKHFMLGQDSCLVFANDIGTGWIYLLVIVVSFWSIIQGIGNKKEKVKE